MSMKKLMKTYKSQLRLYYQLRISMKSAEENLLQPQDSEDENIHTFSLKPFNPKLSPMPSVVVDFSPQFSENQQIAITPKLSQSKDCFHPLFESLYIKSILLSNKPIPQSFMSVKQGLVKSPFSQKSLQYKKDGSKPRPNSKYCQVCKQKFSVDYLDVDLYLIKHIKHIVHVNNLKANPFQKFIQTLTLNFQAKLIPKRNLESNLKEESLSKQKKKVKQDWTGFKSDELKLNFPLKGIYSTESTNNSSAIDQKQKRQALNSLKE